MNPYVLYSPSKLWGNSTANMQDGRKAVWSIPYLFVAFFPNLKTILLLIVLVVYWPTSRLGCQNRKCTYVNNRCIRSRNIRIITLTVDGLNECNCDALKKVGVKLLYNSVKTRSQTVGRSDELETRCGRASQALSRELGPRASGWASGEREKHNADGHKSGGQYFLQLCSVSNSLSHTTLSYLANKLRGIFF